MRGRAECAARRTWRHQLWVRKTGATRRSPSLTAWCAHSSSRTFEFTKNHTNLCKINTPTKHTWNENAVFTIVSLHTSPSSPSQVAAAWTVSRLVTDKEFFPMAAQRRTFLWGRAHQDAFLALPLTTTRPRARPKYVSDLKIDFTHIHASAGWRARLDNVDRPV